MTTANAPLRRLLAQPLFRRWAVANLFARLPLTMNLLALVLVGELVYGSLGTGALLAGVATGSSGLAAQWRGRQLDRGDLRDGLRRDLVLSAAAIAALAVAAALSAPVLVVAFFAGVVGVASAAVLGGFRTVLVECVPPKDIEPANAIDAVFVEVAFIAGPALAGGLALLVGPLGVLGLMFLAFATAALRMGGLPTRRPAGRGRPAGPAPLRTRGASPVYAMVFLVGLSLGGFEAVIPARIEAFGMEAASAGPLLAFTAFGSALAGLAATNLRDPLRHGRLLAGGLLLAFGVLFIPPSVATSPVVLAGGLFLLGLPIAPLNALAGLAFQRTIAVPRQAEGFSLYPAMILIGAGMGQAAVGSLLGVLSAAALLRLLALGPVLLSLLVLAAALRRRLLGMPPGVGFGHDPTIGDPAGYAPGPAAPA